MRPRAGHRVPAAGRAWPRLAKVPCMIHAAPPLRRELLCARPDAHLLPG